MDQVLDVIIEPDLCTAHWKDEQEFADAVASGYFSASEAEEIRAEGERAIGIARSGGSPFKDGWEQWTPAPEWLVPALPEPWDSLCG